MRPMPRNRVGVGATALLVLLLVGAAIIVGRRPAPYAMNGGEYVPARPAPALDLPDQNGQPFSLAAQQGKVSLLYFGYTTCPDLCPTTLSDFAAVKADLGPASDNVNYLLVTFDPERDTPERLREYLGFFDPDFVGLRGDEAQTAAVLKAYGVTVERVEYPESATKYLFDHSALIYLVDPDGNLRASYPYGTDPKLIAEDVAHLLRT